MTAEKVLTIAIREALAELNRRPWMPKPLTDRQVKVLVENVTAWLER